MLRTVRDAAALKAAAGVATNGRKLKKPFVHLSLEAIARGDPAAAAKATSETEPPEAAQLAPLANNINQIARTMNRAPSVVPDGLADDVRQLSDLVKTVRRMIARRTF